MKRINILFLLLSLNVGGTEKHIYDLVLNLKKEKFNPLVCCLYDLGSIGVRLVNNTEGVKVYHNLIRNKWDMAGIWKLIGILKNENIHILYTINSPLTQFWGTILVKFTGVAALVTRVAATKPIFHGKRRKIVNKLMLRFVDKVIAQANSHKEYLISHEGFQPWKVEVIYNGVELKNFTSPINMLSIRRALGIPADALVIGIVARLRPEKGHLIFLQAARKIINVLPQSHFLIVGDGKERKKLEEITQELEIQSNVHFLGIRSDIPQIISLFDVAVLTSNPVVETFSNAILEYMAASKPVVATNVGSTSELVIDGETGFLIPFNDSDTLANAILRLLKDGGLAKKMGEVGREKIKERFTVQKMIAKYESLFADLVK